jgi:hypothetical protein
MMKYLITNVSCTKLPVKPAYDYTGISSAFFLGIYSPKH